MSCYFGDALCTLTTLLLMGVIGFMGVTIAYRRRISLWGKGWRSFQHGDLQPASLPRPGTAITCRYRHPPIRMYRRVFAADTAQSILGSLGGAIAILCALLCLFIRNQKFRKAVFVISAIIAAKILLVEIARTGL